MLDINASYHWMQLQEKLRDQTWENGKKKLVLGLIFAYLAQIWTAKFFFFSKIWLCQSLDVMVHVE